MNYFYLNPIKDSILFIENKSHRKEVIDNILKLRKRLSSRTNGIPEKKLSGNLILGTWNIRELGNTKYGGRMEESIFYIAEIISRFDLIAIQEVRDDLGDFNRILRVLGPDWAVFISTVTEGVSGNKERLAFLYDKRTVSFRNIAGQVIIPGNSNTLQFARAPYVIRFQSGWLQFDICTAHIYFGKAAKNSPEYKRRVKEISTLIGFSKKYFVDKGQSSNLFILGDFNIENKTADTYKAATSSVFKIPDAILKSNLSGTNVKRDKIYDQILFYSKYGNILFKNAGIFDFFDTVFDKFSSYQQRVNEHYDKGIDTQKAFDDFKTYQMSDHLPMWVEMNTDNADSYLEYIKNNA